MVITHQSEIVYQTVNSNSKFSAMFSIKIIFLVVCLVMGAFAEPPRRRSNFKSFARQQTEEQPNKEGYNYEPPAAERLRLPFKLRQFARQEESNTGGYSYPKPTDSYGPPEEETEEPSTDYGVPEGTTEASTEPNDDGATENPQAETLRKLEASQFRRQNGKLTRVQKSQKIRNHSTQQAVYLQQDVQPVFYVQYPASELVQPEYVYIFK